MEYKRNTYSSFDLMKIFGIKKGSWQSIKKKYELDKYAQNVFDSKQNQNKFIYTEEAYNILRDNYKIKIAEEIKENPQMLALISENTTLRATIEEYKNLNTKFEIMYNEEKESKENLIKENATLQVTNSSYIKQNHLLEKAKYELEENTKKEINELQQELDRLKNRGFFARLFNK